MWNGLPIGETLQGKACEFSGLSKITSNLKIFIGGSPLLNYFRSIPQKMYLGEWVLSILLYPLLIYITFKCPLCKIGRIKVLIFQDVLKIKQDKEL